MLRGTVIHGDKRGRILGFPTANLDVSIKQTKHAPGVYAAVAELHGAKYPAALIVHQFRDKIEVYFLDYSGPEFYGEFLEVEPKQRVSAMEKAVSVERLIEKIQSDVEAVRSYFAEQK